MASSIANLVYKLPHELPNDLRLRILGNKDISVKSQSYVDTQPSAQTPFQKLNVGNSSPKINIKVYKFVSKFLDISSFTRLLKRKRNSSFTRENQFWSQLRPVSLKLCFFFGLYIIKAFLQILWKIEGKAVALDFQFNSYE